MKRNEPLSTVMSTELTTVNVTHKLSEVRKLQAEKGIHHVPVVSGTKLVGMISATDMIRVSFSAYGADARAVDAMLDHEFSVEQVMSTELTTLSNTQKVRDAATVLASGKFHSVPVVDAEHNLVGLVTSTDLIRYLADQF